MTSKPTRRPARRRSSLPALERWWPFVYRVLSSICGLALSVFSVLDDASDPPGQIALIVVLLGPLAVNSFAILLSAAKGAAGGEPNWWGTDE